MTQYQVTIDSEILCLVKAVEIHFQGVTWQRCQTHFVRNLLDACPKSLQRELHG
ncbi:transposase [Thermatribacter velox]|uniref:Transposase n=1 Tax=Thermatribacter velox TaxID=3039681 RepID=A0ABZ2YAB8_9BACT